MIRIVTLIAILLYSSTINAQNIGIGTKTPTRARLEVHGSVGNTSAIFGGDTTGVSLQSNWPTIGFNEYFNNGHRYIAKGYAAQQFIDPVLGYMAFDFFSSGNKNSIATGQKRALALTYNGDMLVGDGTGRITINRGPDDRSGFNGMLQIRQTAAGGNIGISVTDETYAHNWRMRCSDASTGSFFSVGYNGWDVGFFRSNDGVYMSFSDRRLKSDIRELPSVLDKLMQLKPVHYSMNNNNKAGKRSTGFIAQDVQQLFPELVEVLEEPTASNKSINNLHALNYTGFSVIAIKAIQEQQRVIETLKKQVEQITNELTRLKQASR
jgi:hypothetical protein